MTVYTHGRLVARLRRLVARLEVTGSDYHRRRVLETVRDLIVEERRAADPLARAVQPSEDEIRARLRLMAPGGGIEVPR